MNKQRASFSASGESRPHRRHGDTGVSAKTTVPSGLCFCFLDYDRCALFFFPELDYNEFAQH